MSPLGVTVYGCDPDEAELFAELAPRLGVEPHVTSVDVSVGGADALFPGDRCISVDHRTALSAPTLRALGAAGVGYVSTRSIGFDHIDLDAADDLGIVVENVVYAPDGVADYTVMLILMALRDAKATTAAVARNDFRPGGVRGRDLRDLTAGVVGVGRIGEAVVRRLQGFGCRVLAHDARGTAGVEAVPASFDQLLVESDVVTLHVPLDADTHHVIGREQIAMMRPGAVLVNTGRGGLVDTHALVAALEAGRLGGAALDVVEGEEAVFSRDCSDRVIEDPVLRRLLAVPGAIVTPHTAYYTQRMLRDTVEGTLVRCLSHERRRAHAEA